MRLTAAAIAKSRGYPRFRWRRLQPNPVIGVDEVGRGCLAGPVYAAAVMLPKGHDDSQYTDSKLLSEGRRDCLFQKIIKDCRVGIGIATVQEIFEINILWASLLAMKRAVEALDITVGHVLVDGKFLIPDLGTGFRQTALIKGDLRAAPISAASIVAKVSRDLRMTELDSEHPAYGFLKNKGYGTLEHQKAIQKFGPTIHHRVGFKGVSERQLSLFGLASPLLSSSDRS